MSRIVDASVMKAMLMHVAPAEVGRRTRIQPVATNRARMHVNNERPLPRRRTSALRKIDGLQRVDCGQRQLAAITGYRSDPSCRAIASCAPTFLPDAHQRRQ
jgi:hypothetical protein